MSHLHLSHSLASLFIQPRSVMESWDKLSPADKKFIINTISYALKSVKERMNE